MQLRERSSMDIFRPEKSQGNQVKEGKEVREDIDQDIEKER